MTHASSSAGIDVPLLYSPHHDGSALYVSNQHPQLGDVVEVRVRVPRQAGVSEVVVRTVDDGEMRLTPAHLLAPAHLIAPARREDHARLGDCPSPHAELQEDWWAADIRMNNEVMRYRFRFDGGPTGVRWLNGAGLWDRTVPDDADFRLTTYPKPPAWVQGAVVYQIFPDRFASTGRYSDPAPEWAIPTAWDEPVADVEGIVGRQFYGGDLDGITEHLDHIQALGVNVIYMTPIFPGHSNHRYNASSFAAVDPLLGGDDAFARLCEAAHARGIRVMGDFTSNHTGDTHEWFIRAAADTTSRERDYYYWREDGSYVAWFDVPTLPKLNHRSAELQRHLFDETDGPVRKWLHAGLDGWRIDVANMTGRMGSDDLNHEVARHLRHAAVAENPDALIIAEHYFDYSSDLQGDGWHGVMNYSGFTFPIWGWLHNPADTLDYLHGIVETPHLNGSLMVETIRDFSARVPWQNLVASFNLLDSHDTARIATLLARREDLIGVACTLMMTMPAMPMIEYGDEIGMEGLTGEDGRRPMPWHPEQWDHQILETYRDLAAIRHGSAALREGGMRWIYADDDAVAYLRESATETVLVYAARAHSSTDLPAELLLDGAEVRCLYQSAGATWEVDGSELRLHTDGPAALVLSWGASDGVGKTTRKEID